MRSAIPNQWEAAPCLDLVNSRFSDHLGSGKFFDRLREPVWRRWFLERWSYSVDTADDSHAIARLACLRAIVRSALEAHASGRPLSRSVRGALEGQMNVAPARLAISDGVDGYELSIQRSGADWDVVIAQVATSAVRLLSARQRVKVCANVNCSWMFVDESRAGARRWCDVSVCGSLVNVRRHRSRRTGDRQMPR